MKNQLNNNTLILFPEGQISSSNANDISAEFDKIISNNPHESIIVDLGEISYVSSAGLRIFLNIKKKENNFKIINVSKEVYDIFSMTGFTQIIEIEKALAEVSIEGKQLIGQGYMGKIYRMDPETIIKVNYRVDSVESIKHERELAKKAFVLGVPTAISYDVVKVKEGGYGSMFELITDDSICGLINKHPEDLQKYVDIYTDLLLKIREAKDDTNTLPRKKDDALMWVKQLRECDYYDKSILDKMEQLINNVNDDANLVHGDFHIKNVMMQNNEALLIDMDTLGIGNTIFELTPMFLTYVGYPSTEPGNLQSFLGISDEQGEIIFNQAIKKLLSTDDENTIKTTLNKAALLGYMWLTLKTHLFEPENKVRLEHSIKMVNDLINVVDTLNV